MAIERDLHRLLYTHDCVIVPRFGGFLTHYRSARLDEQRGVIHPPGKDVSFNRHLVRTDGLLAHETALREGLDHAKASAVVEGEVDSWRAKLERDGRLEIARIGTFYRDAEKNLQFDPDKRVNFLKDAYGLRNVAAVAVARPEPVVRPNVVPLQPVPVAPIVSEPRRVPLLLAAAAVVAICFTGGTWWLVSRGGPEGAQWSGFDLFRDNEPLAYTPRSGALPDDADGSDTAEWTAPAEHYGVEALRIAGAGGPMVNVDLGPAPAPTPATEEEHHVVVQPAAPDSTAVATPVVRARYHIIGGCFLMKENADAFVSDLQSRGFAASVIDRKGGLYRVAYGSYPLKALALEALSAVRKEEAPEAWLLSQ